MPTRSFPVAKPALSGLEEKYLVDALRSGWISSHGPYIERFEAEFAAWCGAAEAVTTNNGTTALHLILAAAGVGPGDEVLVPALTYVATANAVTYCGARPVFVDVDAATWCIDIAKIERLVTPRTRAIVAVDLYGHPADYDSLRKLSREHGLLLVADAAESLGGFVGDTPVGALADATTFSFFGNKILTCGEGGCVTTSDRDLAAKMRLLRNQGMDPHRRYYFPVVGFNYRLTNLAAALLCAQLERSSEIIGRRRRVVDLYEAALAGFASFHLQPVSPGVRRAPWLASVLIGDPGTRGMRDRLAERLRTVNVETRPFFAPLPSLPPYRASVGDRNFPVTDDLSWRGINLPTYCELSEQEIAEIIDHIKVAAVA